MPTEEGKNIADAIQKTLKRLTFLVVISMILALGAGVTAVAVAISTGNQSDKQNAALCTFRADLQSRVTQTEKFLLDHPEGFAGIPVAQLRQSLDGQKRTITALSSLECDESTEPVTGTTGATKAP